MPGIKKSQFNASTTIPGSATLDYVFNGVNTKITLDDFAANIGVSGTIAAVGDPAGVPVLDIQGSVNGIRSLVSGPGIDVSLTPLNGIEISTAVTFDETGATLVDNTTATPLNYRSLVAGPGVNINDMTLGQIALSLDTSDVLPDNFVVVNALDDLPLPVSGAITLEPGHMYFLGRDLSSDNEIHFGEGSSWTNGSFFGATWEYTGTGSAFVGSNVNASIRHVDVSSPSGQALDFTSDGTHSLSVKSVSFDGCAKLGALNNLAAARFTLSGMTNTIDGLTLSGADWEIFSLSECSFFGLNGAGIAIDLGASVHNSLSINGCTMQGDPGSIGISGAAASANIAPNTVGAISGNGYRGPITPLQNIGPDDVRFEFLSNAQITDTAPDSLIYIEGNTVPTPVDQNVPTLISGTWLNQGSSHFSVTAAGRITYIGERPITVPVDLAVDIVADSGTNRLIKIYIAFNGTPITASSRLMRSDASRPQAASSPWQITFTQGDFIEGFVENTTNGVDILVSGAVLRVR